MGQAPFTEGLAGGENDVVDENYADAQGEAGGLAGTLVLDAERDPYQGEYEAGKGECEAAVEFQPHIPQYLGGRPGGSDPLTQFGKGQVHFVFHHFPGGLTQVDAQDVVLEFDQAIARLAGEPVNPAVIQIHAQYLGNRVRDDYAAAGKDGGWLCGVSFVMDENSFHGMFLIVIEVGIDDQPGKIVVENLFPDAQRDA